MGMWGQVTGEVQEKEGAGRNEEEAHMECGSLYQSRPEAGEFMFIYLFYVFYHKFTILFGILVPKILMFLGYRSQNY